MVILFILILSYSIIPTVISKYNWRKGLGKDCNKILLTFDDGPDRSYTMDLVNLLKEYDVKASFFMVSEEAKKNIEIVETIVSEGHSLGLHSREHKTALYRGYGFINRDLYESKKDFKEMGYDVKYYRPPWGQLNIFSYILLNKYDLRLILWNVMAEDWRSTIAAEDIEKRLLKRVGPGSIICLHDGRGRSDEAAVMIEGLRNVIPILLEEGYEFVTVDEYYG